MTRKEDDLVMKTHFFSIIPAGIYLLKVNNENTRMIFGICSEFDLIDVVLVYLLLTLNRFYTLFLFFNCGLWIGNYQLGSSVALLTFFCSENQSSESSWKNVLVVISPRPDLNKLLHEFIYRIWTTVQFRNGYFSFYKNNFRWLWWKGSWNARKITSSWIAFEIYATKLFQVIAVFHLENNPMVLNVNQMAGF